MALNVTQVNQAFLGLLGRPATGAEAAKFAKKKANFFVKGVKK